MISTQVTQEMLDLPLMLSKSNLRAGSVVLVDGSKSSQQVLTTLPESISSLQALTDLGIEDTPAVQWAHRVIARDIDTYLS